MQVQQSTVPSRALQLEARSQIPYRNNPGEFAAILA